MNNDSYEPLIGDDAREAIANNEFVAHTLDLVRIFLLAKHADWGSISTETGRPSFRSDEALTLYNAISVILGDDELPEGIGNAQVDIGSGELMPASVVLRLGEAICNRSSS